MKVASVAIVLAVCLVGAWGQPAYEKNTYEIYDGSQLCATWTFAAKLLPEYMRNSSAEPVTQEVFIPGPNETSYPVSLDKSNCPALGMSKLVISFSDQNEFTMIAVSSDIEPGTKANANWTITQIEFKYNLADSVIFPDTASTGINTVSVNNPAGLGTDNEQGGLYQCNSPSFIKLNSTNNLEVDLEIKDVLLNPYQEPADDVKFECAADASSSDDKVVPIAVGCALGGLLLIVVIAFLIGRRSRRTGYKQV